MPTALLHELLADPPVGLPRNWVATVNAPMTQQEEQAVQLSIRRSRPLGDTLWQDKMVSRLKLQWTMRDRGRQKGWRKQHQGNKGLRHL